MFRGLLHKNRSTDESIKFAKSKIDDYVVKYQLASQEKSKALNKIIVGSIILFIGLTITLFSYMAEGSQYILAFGAILTGAWILKEGYKVYSLPIEELVPRRNFIRRW